MLTGMNEDLWVIGKKHATDKSAHRFRGVTYLHIYERYFRDLRNSEITLLEIGVHRGASIRMWYDYFPKAKIFGIDINPACHRFENDRTRIFIGEQQNLAFLDKVVEASKGFDVVIDDGSHINAFTLASFGHLWPAIHSAGIYIIEDLANSYTKDLGADIRKCNWSCRPFIRPNWPMQNRRRDMDMVFMEIVYNLDMRKGDCAFLHFWPMIAVAGKVRE